MSLRAHSYGEPGPPAGAARPADRAKGMAGAVPHVGPTHATVLGRGERTVPASNSLHACMPASIPIRF